MSKNRMQKTILSAVMAALTAILAQIQLPIGPVPVSLATLGVFLSGALLGWKYGAIAQAVYLLLGAVGAPVFAGFSAGPQRLIGPTGGYLVGYVLGAFVIGLLSRKEGSYRRLILAMVAGELALLTVGTAYFMFLTNNGLYASLSTCVIPFLPGDAAKIIVAALTVKRVRPLIS